MKISLYGPSNRPQYWKNLYELLCKNDISFEIVFAGPNKPDFTLPSNFKFIQTNVKPAQCTEIAYRNTEGEYVIYIVDDLIFEEHFLDNLYNKFISEKNDLLVVSPFFITDGIKFPIEICYLIHGDKNSPLLPICGFYKKSVFDMFSGIDRAFIGSWHDLDIFMRFAGYGGKTVYIDNCVSELKIKRKDRKKRLTKILSKTDKFYFYDCWIEKKYIEENGKIIKIKKISKTRLKPAIPFEEKDILIKSQGNNLKEYWD